MSEDETSEAMTAIDDLAKDVEHKRMVYMLHAQGQTPYKEPERTIALMALRDAADALIDAEMKLEAALRAGGEWTRGAA
jgi:hypothetical protein